MSTHSVVKGQPPRSGSPQVTVGMPLYNNETTVRVALESLLTQSHSNLRIFASDDCSSDSTALICEEFARRDGRFTFRRQTQNLGYMNFRYVLDEAHSPYFMWAAGDDKWEPTYVERNVAALLSDVSLVASVSRVFFVSAGQPISLSSGTYELRGSTADKLARFFSHPGDNSRMYGLFRTETLKAAFPPRPFHAYDWAVSAATLIAGNHNEVCEVLLYRDRTARSRYSDLVRDDSSRRHHRLIPLWAMTRWLIVDCRIPLSFPIIMALFALNLDKHFEYAKHFHPIYFRRIRRLRNAWHKWIRPRFIQPAHGAARSAV